MECQIVPHIRYILVSESASTWLNAILAGIWRDWRVEGNVVFPQVSKETIGSQSEIRADENKSRKRHKSSVTNRSIPRVSQGKNNQATYAALVTWESTTDHEVIRRRLHGVSGHQRQLLPGRIASEFQKKLAKEHGILLPEGFTYVTPHKRGGHQDEQVIEPEKEVVLAKVLATMITLDLQ